MPLTDSESSTHEYLCQFFGLIIDTRSAKLPLVSSG